MNLKYYLRGLGIGIIVTALIMSIAMGGRETLSNEEIKERARALGMVEGGTLLEDAQAALNTLEDPAAGSKDESDEQQNLKESGTPEEPSEPSENDAPEDTSEQLENEAPEETLKQPESDAPEETPQQSEEQQPEKDQGAEDAQEPEVIIEQEGIWPPDEAGADESVTVQVVRGEGSYTVCKRLEEAGIISSASEFDTFLCQNGYDKKIRAGTFEIPGNASPEQIARILSGT